mgnify:FL=1
MLRDFSRVDTTPGATGMYATFAPPESAAGSREEYLAWLKTKIRDLRVMTWFFTGQARCTKLEIVGPFAEDFKFAFDRVLATMGKGSDPRP